MTFKCKNKRCNNNTKQDNSFCDGCYKVIETYIIKRMWNYLSEDYMLKDNYERFTCYKIVDHQLLKNSIKIRGYSNEFLRYFYGNNKSEITLEKVNKSIIKLKNSKLKLYEALQVLWGKPVSFFQCHKSTVYRRINRALKFLAKDLGILTSNS